MATLIPPGVVPDDGLRVIQFCEALALQARPATVLDRLIRALEEPPAASEKVRFTGVAVTLGIEMDTRRIRLLLSSAM